MIKHFLTVIFCYLFFTTTNAQNDAYVKKYFKADNKSHKDIKLRKIIGNDTINVEYAVELKKGLVFIDYNEKLKDSISKFRLIFRLENLDFSSLKIDESDSINFLEKPHYLSICCYTNDRCVKFSSYSVYHHWYIETDEVLNCFLYFETKENAQEAYEYLKKKSLKHWK